MKDLDDLISELEGDSKEFTEAVKEIPNLNYISDSILNSPGMRMAKQFAHIDNLVNNDLARIALESKAMAIDLVREPVGLLGVANGIINSNILNLVNENKWLHEPSFSNIQSLGLEFDNLRIGLSGVEFGFHTHLSSISDVYEPFTRINNAINRFQMPINDLLINHWEDKLEYFKDEIDDWDDSVIEELTNDKFIISKKMINEMIQVAIQKENSKKVLSKKGFWEYASKISNTITILTYLASGVSSSTDEHFKKMKMEEKLETRQGQLIKGENKSIEINVGIRT